VTFYAVAAAAAAVVVVVLTKKIVLYRMDLVYSEVFVQSVRAKSDIARWNLVEYLVAGMDCWVV